ncbi:hypothetical protein G6F38_013116 [Rhizopus arrhizus]|nr:hypothetical protein G6F38_013116 [Rhizopus arrhizus]
METNTGSIDDSHVATDEVTMDQAIKNIPQSQHQAAMDSHHNDASTGYNFRHDSLDNLGLPIPEYIPKDQQHGTTVSKELLFNISSLNCNSLVKTHDTQKQSNFIRYSDHENFINVQFQVSQSLWTRHCGLLSFSSKYQLSDNLIPSNPRIILSKISHPQNFYAPFHVLVVYAPASTANIDPHRIIILGDFNYSYHRLSLSTQTSLKWVMYLEEFLYNVMHSGDNRQTPTGFGLWRANPILDQQKAYRVQLKQRLTGIVSSLPNQMTAQEQWDYVKSEIRLFTQRYAVDYTNWPSHP